MLRFIPLLDPPMPLTVPLFLVHVSAGFPSPAEDYLEGPLDLNVHLIKKPAATFFVRATGDSMRNVGIHSGDLLVVDRSLKASNGRVVIAVVNGELTVKLFSLHSDGIYLMPANDQFEPIHISEDADFEIWGIVTFVIHRV